MCLSRYTVKLKEPIFDVVIKEWVDKVGVPCGKCDACLHQRINQWIFRIEQEEKHCLNAMFVTLTYEEAPVATDEDTGEIDVTLRKDDLVKFMKRLRAGSERRESPTWSEMKKYGEKRQLPIKFYAVGEYGDESGRPHYHLILFNAWEYHVKEAWKLGRIDFGECHRNTIKYTLKYFEKQQGISEWNSCKEKPFNLMSKGIGASYLTEEIKQYHRSSLDRYYLTDRKGYKVAMPKFYKDKIYSKAESEDIRQLVHTAVVEREAEERRYCELNDLDWDKQQFIIGEQKRSKKRTLARQRDW